MRQGGPLADPGDAAQLFKRGRVSAHAGVVHHDVAGIFQLGEGQVELHLAALDPRGEVFANTGLQLLDAVRKVDGKLQEAVVV